MKNKLKNQSTSVRIARWTGDVERAIAVQYLDYGDIGFSKLPDGRILARLEGRGLKSHECVLSSLGGDFLYVCDCQPSQRNEAAPCPHILAATTAAEYDGLLDSNGIVLVRQVGLLDEGIPKGMPAEIWCMPRNDRPRRLTAKASVELLGEMPKPAPVWKPLFEALRSSPNYSGLVTEERWPAGKELVYAVDVAATMEGKGLVIETLSRERKKDGTWKKAVATGTSAEMVKKLPDPVDREIIALLAGAQSDRAYYYATELATKRRLSEAHATALLPRLCRSGRAFLRRVAGVELDPSPLQWDDGDAWQLAIEIRREEADQCFILDGHIERGDKRLPISEPVLLTAKGNVFFADGTVALFDDLGAFPWVILLRARAGVRVPFDQSEELLSELYSVPRLPKLHAPESLSVQEETVPMRPRLLIKAAPKGKYHSYYGTSNDEKLIGELSFGYGEQIVDSKTSGTGIFDRKKRSLIRRDAVAETAARDRMFAVGFRDLHCYGTGTVVPQLPPKAMPGVIRTLATEGWHVEAEGKLYRQAGEIRVDVTSGIDWFDLNVKADFGGVSASLPALLAALRKGENIVRLVDGTFGMLPEEWLKKYGPLAGAGKTHEDSVRFSRTQVGLLDALLASQPEATCDEAFRRTRDELHRFDGIPPVDPPETFVGELRPYQREGLGWFEFLRRFGFGGCLADDMGLGKTVQVLAMLEARRQGGEANTANRKPSLVVVPRSLVFNWKQEAAKFAPQLKVLDHTTSFRKKDGAHFAAHDLVLTTYGTLRNDAPFIKDRSFDYVVLDEAQAVKNSASEAAKAVRLLQGDHRLCLSGTPVQNHLGELWSLFDFLNPGMLGQVNLFSSATMKNPDPDTRAMLSRGLRPFILRRTKSQVAKDLPEKQEQTLFCELDAEQRKMYDDLRDHYRLNLLGQIQEKGLAKSKFMILEALLRLRQAACHPALIDKKLTAAPSAKLDALMPRLAEVIDEGHKALVFSQFTSFLSLVRKQLDKDGIVYEYLDGKTRDRQARVDRFQTDPNCKLFLISLKAGGVGLNLTAADYVFLLDPWWNPAVEAQAIDRTHRIGQTRQVFAFRLIAKNTVEEKVLALQQTKRDLADAIINADNSLIRSLGKEDLELLLS